VTPIIEPPGTKDVEPTPFRPAYVTRRRLESGELLAAGGIAAGVAALVFYLATVWMERTPLLPDDADVPPPGVRPRARR
jgi:hypothetical protein